MHISRSQKLALSAIVTFTLVTASANILYFTLGENLVEAMKSIVEVNAALIGFLAIAVVFMLTSTESEKRYVESRLQSLEKAYYQCVKKCVLDENIGESEYSKLYKEIGDVAYRLGTMDGFAPIALKWSIVSAAAFVASIFFALFAMSNNTALILIGINMTFSMMVVGIAEILLLLYQYSDIKYVPKYPSVN